MSKREKSPIKPSTKLFIAAGLLALVGLLQIGFGVVDIFASDVVGTITGFVLGAILLYAAWSMFRYGKQVRKMSIDQSLLAAALCESLLRSGQASGNVSFIVSDGEVEDIDDMPEDATDFVPTKRSGTLEELRAARKGPNASN